MQATPKTLRYDGAPAIKASSQRHHAAAAADPVGLPRYLDHHKPWLVKDPRLVWFAPLWLERLDHPLCVIPIDLQPWKLAEELSEHSKGAISPAVHLERWTNSTLSTLKVTGSGQSWSNGGLSRQG